MEKLLAIFAMILIVVLLIQYIMVVINIKAENYYIYKRQILKDLIPLFPMVVFLKNIYHSIEKSIIDVYKKAMKLK